MRTLATLQPVCARSIIMICSWLNSLDSVSTWPHQSQLTIYCIRLFFGIALCFPIHGYRPALREYSSCLSGKNSPEIIVFAYWFLPFGCSYLFYVPLFLNQESSEEKVQSPDYGREDHPDNRVSRPGRTDHCL